MSWMVTGVTGASLASSAFSAFSGSSKAKKRQAELQRKIQALKDKIASSTRNRLKEVDKLTDQQMTAADDQLNLVLDYYSTLKVKFQGLKERNQAEAERQFGQKLKDIESTLQEEIGIQTEVFDQYRTDLDSLYVDNRDLIQADLAYNTSLKDEFKTNADQAIKDTWEASGEAKIDLQKLNDSGGRPENFDRVVAENAQAFGEINNKIDRSDAQRGRSDLTGKKMTSMFAEAMSKGNISGNMGEAGQRQEQSLRGEIAGLGNQAMSQSNQAMRGATTNDGQIMANLAHKFRGTAIDATMKEGMNRLNMETDANVKGEIAQDLLTQTKNELQRMVDRGELTREEAELQANQMNTNLKMDATQNNWSYKNTEALNHEGAMMRTLGGADRELQSIDTSVDYGGIINDGVSAFTSMQGGGSQKPAKGSNPNLIAEGNYNSEFESFLGKAKSAPKANSTVPRQTSDMFGSRKLGRNYR